MKKAVALIAFAAAMAGAAQAKVYTVKFEVAGAEPMIVKFDDATKQATDSTGATSPYTIDPEARKLCGKPNGVDTCVVLETLVETPGTSTPFTASDGKSGTATLMSVE